MTVTVAVAVAATSITITVTDYTSGNQLGLVQGLKPMADGMGTDGKSGLGLSGFGFKL